MTEHPATAPTVAAQSNVQLRPALGGVPYAFPNVPTAAVFASVAAGDGAQAVAEPSTGARADAGPSTSTAGISTAAATSPITIF